MDETLRTPVIAGNWKMNMAPPAAVAFMREFATRHAPATDRTVVLFPPALSLWALKQALSGRGDIGLGVQDIHWEPDGAFTGATSAAMARAAGARYALAGHSERRHVFGETDEEVGRKAAAAAAADMVPMICVGEQLEEREAGRLEEVVLRQLDAALEPLGAEPGTLAVAYEPVWAIGTGVTATPADASAAHAILRRRLEARYGAERAGGMPILYGGSVKPDNAAELLAADGVDGVLVGGASLEAESFAAIAAAG
ncbi:MAG: triose-phosphate isomerase [Gemmatimonadota bacterium]